ITFRNTITRIGHPKIKWRLNGAHKVRRHGATAPRKTLSHGRVVADDDKWERKIRASGKDLNPDDSLRKQLRPNGERGGIVDLNNHDRSLARWRDDTSESHAKLG